MFQRVAQDKLVLSLPKGSSRKDEDSPFPFVLSLSKDLLGTGQFENKPLLGPLDNLHANVVWCLDECDRRA